MREIVLVAHNIRSAHNVGSLLRTADGLAAKVYLTGYTPYPRQDQDDRLPHIAKRVHARISKTALGAEDNSNWTYEPDILACLEGLRQSGYKLAALEQAPGAKDLASFKAPAKIALIVGSEVSGLDSPVLNQADYCLQVPMLGTKESFNVAAAAAMALYQLRHLDK